MPVRSLEIATGALAGGTALTVVYTVPTDRTLILKHSVLNVPGAAAGTVSLAIARPPANAVFLVQNAPLGPNGARADDWWAVLEEGDTISVQPGTATMRYWLSGALLMGDPS